MPNELKPETITASHLFCLSLFLTDQYGLKKLFARRFLIDNAFAIPIGMAYASVK
jgi:hypothetical protein